MNLCICDFHTFTEFKKVYTVVVYEFMIGTTIIFKKYYNDCCKLKVSKMIYREYEANIRNIGNLVLIAIPT